jgi:hypothetical protein
MFRSFGVAMGQALAVRMDLTAMGLSNNSVALLTRLAAAQRRRQFGQGCPAAPQTVTSFT